MKVRYTIISLVVLVGVFMLAEPTLAQGRLFNLPPCTKDGNCQISDLVNVAVYAGKFFQAIAGALALALFIYGGILMMIAGGRSEYVQKGKTVLTAAAVGLIIVLGAYVVVASIEKALKGQPTGPGTGPQNRITTDSGCIFHTDDEDNTYACVNVSSAAERQSRIQSGECVANLCSGGELRICCQAGPREVQGGAEPMCSACRCGGPDGAIVSPGAISPDMCEFGAATRQACRDNFQGAPVCIR